MNGGSEQALNGAAQVGSTVVDYSILSLDGHLLVV